MTVRCGDCESCHNITGNGLAYCRVHGWVRDGKGGCQFFRSLNRGEELRKSQEEEYRRSHTNDIMQTRILESQSRPNTCGNCTNLRAGVCGHDNTPVYSSVWDINDDIRKNMYLHWDRCDGYNMSEINDRCNRDDCIHFREERIMIGDRERYRVRCDIGESRGIGCTGWEEKQ